MWLFSKHTLGKTGKLVSIAEQAIPTLFVEITSDLYQPMREAFNDVFCCLYVLKLLNNPGALSDIESEKFGFHATGYMKIFSINLKPSPQKTIGVSPNQISLYRMSL